MFRIRTLHCYFCGHQMDIAPSGASNHLTKDGSIDYDQDALHVAVAQEFMELDKVA